MMTCVARKRAHNHTMSHDSTVWVWDVWGWGWGGYECEMKEPRGYVVIYTTWKYLSTIQPIKTAMYQFFLWLEIRWKTKFSAALINCWQRKLSSSSHSVFKRETFCSHGPIKDSCYSNIWLSTTRGLLGIFHSLLSS